MTKLVKLVGCYTLAHWTVLEQGRLLDIGVLDNLGTRKVNWSAGHHTSAACDMLDITLELGRFNGRLVVTLISAVRDMLDITLELGRLNGRLVVTLISAVCDMLDITLELGRLKGRRVVTFLQHRTSWTQSLK